MKSPIAACQSQRADRRLFGGNASVCSIKFRRGYANNEAIALDSIIQFRVIGPANRRCGSRESFRPAVEPAIRNRTGGTSSPIAALTFARGRRQY